MMTALAELPVVGWALAGAAADTVRHHE